MSGEYVISLTESEWYVFDGLLEDCRIAVDGDDLDAKGTLADVESMLDKLRASKSEAQRRRRDGELPIMRRAAESRDVAIMGWHDTLVLCREIWSSPATLVGLIDAVSSSYDEALGRQDAAERDRLGTYLMNLQGLMAYVLVTRPESGLETGEVTEFLVSLLP